MFLLLKVARSIPTPSFKAVLPVYFSHFMTSNTVQGNDQTNPLFLFLFLSSHTLLFHGKVCFACGNDTALTTLLLAFRSSRS
jgi:hypothetical protein